MSPPLHPADAAPRGSASSRAGAGSAPAFPREPSESRFRVLSAASPIGMFETDAEGQLTYANPRACQLWACDANDVEAMYGHGWLERVHPDDREALIAEWRSALTERREMLHDYRLLLPSGAMRYIHAHAVPLTDGSGVTIGTVEDVTARRLAEAELRRQAQAFAMIHDAVVVTDMAGHVVDWNSAAERIFGWTREEMLGRPMTLTHDPDFAEAQHAAIVAGIAGREGRWTGELRFRRKDGTAGVCEASVVVLRDADGRPIGGIGVNRDVTERSRAEAALRESEARYRLLVEASHQGICQVDRAGAITYCNGRLADMLGYTPAELCGRTLFEFMDAATVVAARARFAHGQRAVSEVDDLALRRRDGTTVWVRASVSPTAFGDGTSAGAMYMLSDISDRHEAQQRLLASERHFRALTELSSELVGVIDATGMMRYTNPACARLLGYQPGESVGQPVFEFVHPDDRERVQVEFARLLEAPGALLTVEYRVLRSEGGWRLLSAVAQNLLADPAVRGVVVNAHDITARRAADEALEQQREMLRAVLDHLPVMIVVLDRECRPVLANVEWSRISGWTLEDVRQHDLMAELYPDAELRARAAATIDLAAGEWGDFSMRARDGRMLDTVWATVRLSDGTRVSIGQDMTERRQLEQQFRQAQKIEAIGRLAGGVAHDFNNLLSVIASYSGMMLADLEPDTPMRDDLHEIQRAVERGSALTTQLLAFSRKQVLQARVVDLAEVVAATETMLRRLIGEDIRVVFEAHERGLHVKADPGQLEQVLMNLAVNARDAMPAGGTLQVRVDEIVVHEEAARRLTGGATGTWVRLTVRDTGVGMDAETRQRIFEPFFTTKKPGQGTGLGLATVYGIVKQSGGFIWVESAPGSGATFTILLPSLAAPDGASAAPEARPQGAQAPGGTVLLVEDEGALRAAARRLLEKQGYEVISAADGSEALRLAVQRGTPVDLVVTDIVMPHVSGQELVNHLVPLFGEIPVLFMSGYAIDAVERHGELWPGATFLTKPFTPEQLLDAVAQTLAGASRRRLSSVAALDTAPDHTPPVQETSQR